MAERDYSPSTSEERQLFPLTLDIKVDGPMKRRIEELTNEVATEYPNLPPIMWGGVLFAGFRLFQPVWKAILREG